MTAQLSPDPVFQWITTQGTPAVGYQLFTYAAGTSTPQATYVDSTQTTQNTNPVILNSAGYASVWLVVGLTYKLTLQDAAGNPIWSIDQISGGYVLTAAAILALLTAQNLGAIIYPRTAAEIAAAIIPTNFGYNNNPHDIRRYGAVMDGVTDDTPAWSQLALVMAQGGNGYVPPLPTLMTSQVTFTGPASGRVELSGYGCVIHTTNAIDAIRATSFTSLGGITFLGLTVTQTDSNATGGFNAFGSLNCYFIDCAVQISSTISPSSGYFCFAAQQSNPSDPTTGALWNYFIRCKTRQTSGNPATYAPFGVFIAGQANANNVLNCTFGSIDYAVALYNQLGGSNPHALPNAILIDGNAFEGGVQAVLINGQNDATSQVSGLRVTNNRAESLTGGFLLLQGLGANTTGVPIWMAGNYVLQTVAAYITQSNVAALQVTVNAMDPSLIPGWLTGVNTSIKSTGPFLFSNNASTGGLYDVIQGTVQTSGGGFALFNSTGTLLGSLRYNGTSAVLNLATGGGYQFNGTQVLSAQITGYGTPTGGSHQASFAAGAITLPNLAAAVAQLIIDLKTHGMIAT